MWTCANCGESIDENLATCWKCGAERDGATTRGDAMFEAPWPARPEDDSAASTNWDANPVEPLAPGWVLGAIGSFVTAVVLYGIAFALWENAVTNEISTFGTNSSRNEGMVAFAAILAGAGSVFWLIFLTIICTVVALRVYESRKETRRAAAAPGRSVRRAARYRTSSAAAAVPAHKQPTTERQRGPLG